MRWCKCAVEQIYGLTIYASFAIVVAWNNHVICSSSYVVDVLEEEGRLKALAQGGNLREQR